MKSGNDTNWQSVELRELRRQIEELRKAEAGRKKTEEELKSALKRLEDEKARSDAIIDAIGDGITIQDREFRIIYQNQACIDDIGDHIGEYCYMAYEGKEGTCENCPVAMSFKDGGIHTVVRSVLTDKGMRYFENTASVLRDSEGNVMAGIEVTRDITERKKAGDELFERERQATLSAEVGAALVVNKDLRSLLQPCAESIVKHLDAAFARIWTLNEKGNVLELQASAGLYTHIDGPHSRVPVGKFKIGLIAEEKKPHLTNDVINDPRISDPEWAKREAMVAFAGHPLIVADKLVGVIAMFSKKPLNETVLTALAAIADAIALGIERKKSEEALKQSTSHLKIIIDTAPQCLKLVAADGTLLEINPAGLSMIEADSLDRVEGKSIYSLITPEYREVFREHIEDTYKGKAGTLEFKILGLKGTHRWLSMHSVPFRDAKGEITALLGITDDVTENRKLREQLFQAQKMEAIGQLAAGIAHDFNNILTAIIGYGHILHMRMASDDPLMINIEQILESANRAASLTQNLLAFSMKQIINLKPADLNELIRKVEKFLLRIIGEDIEVRTKLNREVLIANVDSAQIEQALLNLAANARDAMPLGGLLSIETAFSLMDDKFIKAHGFGKPGKYALISVTDTGAGMDERTSDRIFEPFFTTKEVGKGTGLGLAMVYGTVKQHNGHITVYSEPGKGTTFMVYIPLVAQRVKEEQEAEAVPPALPAGQETVLVAEDDPGLRKLYSELLTDYGYNVIVAEDGEDAINKFIENKDKIRVCILDIIMPKKSGREVYEAIKSISPGIKVLFASGYSDDRIHLKDLAEEGLNFIQKPFLPAALFKKIREMTS